MTAQEVFEIYRRAKEAGIVTKSEEKIILNQELPKEERLRVIANLKLQMEKLANLRRRMEEHPEDWIPDE